MRLLQILMIYSMVFLCILVLAHVAEAVWWELKRMAADRRRVKRELQEQEQQPETKEKE